MHQRSGAAGQARARAGAALQAFHAEPRVDVVERSQISDIEAAGWDSDDVIGLPVITAEVAQ